MSTEISGLSDKVLIFIRRESQKKRERNEERGQNEEEIRVWILALSRR